MEAFLFVMASVAVIIGLVGLVTGPLYGSRGLHGRGARRGAVGVPAERERSMRGWLTKASGAGPSEPATARACAYPGALFRAVRDVECLGKRLDRTPIVGRPAASSR